MLSQTERAIFGRSFADEPVYNVHVIEAILKHVAPGLGWR